MRSLLVGECLVIGVQVIEKTRMNESILDILAKSLGFLTKELVKLAY